MSKSIRISDELAARAEAEAAISHRSPPQQIEHWAQIGRLMEPALSYSASAKMKQLGRPELKTVLQGVESEESIRRTQAIIRKSSGTIESEG